MFIPAKREMVAGVRRVVADSSSIILLHRVGLFARLQLLYRIVVATAVFDEVARGPSRDAMELKHLLRDYIDDSISVQGCKNAGELATVMLYNKGAGDFVLLDDGKAARLCRRDNIPFINSLLLPRILFFSGHLCEERAHVVTRELEDVGYYSNSVIASARRFTAEDLSQFFPI